MKRVGIVYLIAETPEAKGVLDDATETRRKTYCEEKSLSMSETYQARASGFAPQIRLSLPQDFEYRGETVCEYKGERYNIIRDYRDEKNGDSTELTLERVRGNAAKADDPATTTGGSDQDDGKENTAQGQPAETGEPAENGSAPDGDPDSGGAEVNEP